MVSLSHRATIKYDSFTVNFCLNRNLSNFTVSIRPHRSGFHRRKIWHGNAYWSSSLSRPLKSWTFQNSTWRTAAVLKIEKSRYLGNALTDHQEIGQGDVKHWTVNARRQCGLLSNYFNHLLLLWLLYYYYCYSYCTVSKTSHLCLLQLQQTSTDFDNFWHTTAAKFRLWRTHSTFYGRSLLLFSERYLLSPVRLSFVCRLSSVCLSSVCGL